MLFLSSVMKLVIMYVPALPSMYIGPIIVPLPHRFSLAVAMQKNPFSFKRAAVPCTMHTALPSSCCHAAHNIIV